MSQAPDVQILADHSALLAIPAFAPAILVVAVVIWVARRDRRLGDDEDDQDGTP
jgi:phosphate starvation-inducible membrane PsiE